MLATVFLADGGSLLLAQPHFQSTNLGRAARDDLQRRLRVEPHVRPPVDLPLVALRRVARRVRRDPARRQPVELLKTDGMGFLREAASCGRQMSTF